MTMSRSSSVLDVPLASDAARERTRLQLVLLTVFNAVAGVILFSFVPGSDGWTAAALCLFNNAILIGFTVWTRDPVIARLLVFGLAVGVVELAADAWIVDVTGTLDYTPSHSMMVWRSPWWMIMAWELVALQFAYIGLRLRDRFGALGLALSGLLGAVNIPFYEEMALRLSWWRYGGCPMLSNTPYYIIIGEFFLVVCFGLLAPSVRRSSWLLVGASGALAGVCILASYFLAWQLVARFA
jgi:hypothetical protein